MARFGRCAVLIVFVVTLVLSASNPEADAGGSWMYPVKDRYEAGETVTMVGYFGGGAYGPLVDEPYFAHLRQIDEDGTPFGEQMTVGELEFSEHAFQWRAAIAFALPLDLAAGHYMLDYCTADCERRVGDLVGGFVYVGVDPEYPISRSWPADEPEIENLADDVRLWINGLETTAADVRSGSWVPQSTPEPHNDYPPATQVPTAIRETAIAVPTPATSALQVLDPLPVTQQIGVVADSSTGPANDSRTSAVVIGALAISVAAAAAGQRILRARSLRLDE